MREVELPKGYIYAGPWMYHWDSSRHWKREDWLVWDGEEWISCQKEI